MMHTPIELHVQPNVCDVIVPNDLCIGCGICVAVCPVNVLDMQFNDYGEYVPIELPGCLPKCRVCVDACPFSDQSDNEDTLGKMLYGEAPEVKHRPETGYYLECYVGYSNVNGQRANGSSGGLATWFLTRLLREGIVDRVISVNAHPGTDRLYQFGVFTTPEEVEAASRSIYYPVEMSQVLSEIWENEGRYAITGIPCFIKGLRLAMRRNYRLRNRIVVTVGLVCGQSKSKYYAEYLAAKVGGDPNALVNIEFRKKDAQRPANDYGCSFTWKTDGGERSATIFQSEGMSEAWVNDYFKPTACNYCDDVFAETADVVFMDAWLPQYVGDYRGHSIVLNRSQALRELWTRAMTSSEVTVAPIAVDDAIHSQRGVLRVKREGLQFRTLVAQREGKVFPRKRWAPAKAGSPFERQIWRTKLIMARQTRKIWAQRKDAAALDKALIPHKVLVKLLRTANGGLNALRENRLREALQTWAGRKFR